LLLPPGQILHKDLSSSFTNFENLMLDLRQNRFNGYIRINFWGYEGILILDVGKIIQAYSSEKENFLLGEQAVLRIMDKTTEKDGTIDVHALSNEMAMTLASVLGSTLYKSVDIMTGPDIRELFKTLEKVSLTGYVDLQFSNKKGLATVYFWDGIPVEAVIMSNTGRIVSGEVIYQKILEFSNLIKTSIKVFRNNKVEHIREENSFLLPYSKTPALEYWNRLMKLLHEEINSILKKEDFLLIWQASKSQIAGKYPCFDPISGSVEWGNDGFYVKGIVSLSEFWEGMIESLAISVEKIPARRRKKIKIGKILDRVNKEVSDISQDSLMENTYTIIRKIFRKVK